MSELILIDSGSYTKDIKRLENEGVIFPYWCPIDSVSFDGLNSIDSLQLTNFIMGGRYIEFTDVTNKRIKWIIYPIEFTSTGDSYINKVLTQSNKGFKINYPDNIKDLVCKTKKDLENIYSKDTLLKNFNDYQILSTLILSEVNLNKWYVREGEMTYAANHLGKRISKLVTNDKKGIFHNDYRDVLREKFSIEIIYTNEVSQTKFT